MCRRLWVRLWVPADASGITLLEQEFRATVRQPTWMPGTDCREQQGPLTIPRSSTN
ncbi:hypothetical protein LEMLEM_LOCUS16449, partial [Lemmus lemmus]